MKRLRGVQRRMNVDVLLRRKVGVEWIVSGSTFSSESVALYAWRLNRRIYDGIINLIIAFHLYSFVVDMSRMQCIKVDNGNGKTYQEL